MKSAKEMFKELGYNCQEYKYKIIYEKRYGVYDCYYTCLEFGIVDKSLLTYTTYSERYKTVFFNQEELKAITQQLKELQEVENHDQ